MLKNKGPSDPQLFNTVAKYSDNIIMMAEGTVYAVGKPSEVITAENIKAVYDVDAEVVVRNGRPFTVLLDKEFNDDASAIPKDASVTGRTLSDTCGVRR